MEQFVAFFTAIAGTLILIGGVLLLTCQGNIVTASRGFVGEPMSFRDILQIAVGALHGKALETVQLGILLLIATPVLRVFFVGVGYMIERDWLYVIIATIVLAVLGASLIGHRP